MYWVVEALLIGMAAWDWEDGTLRLRGMRQILHRFGVRFVFISQIRLTKWFYRLSQSFGTNQFCLTARVISAGTLCPCEWLELRDMEQSNIQAQPNTHLNILWPVVKSDRSPELRVVIYSTGYWICHSQPHWSHLQM